MTHLFFCLAFLHYFDSHSLRRTWMSYTALFYMDVQFNCFPDYVENSRFTFAVLWFYAFLGS